MPFRLCWRTLRRTTRSGGWRITPKNNSFGRQMALALTPRLLRRGLELFAAISLGGVALLVAYYLIRFGDRVDVLLSPFLRLHWGWIAAGLVLASMDWFGGGLRLWVCTRHVHPSVRLRDMVLAGGFGAWAAYLTPFQSGSAPVSMWVMKRAGVPVPVALSSIFVTFIATVGFFAIAGPVAVLLGAGQSLSQHGLVLGITLYDLFKTSLTIFGLIGLLMLTAVIFPAVMKRLIQRLAGRFAGRSPKAAERMAELTSAAVMSIYVPRELTPSYTLIWRFINSYATVIAGSLIFWYWLRSGLIGREESVGVT